MSNIRISFAHYDLKGKGRRWLKSVSVEDRKAFSYVGRMYAGHGRMGGKARAESAWRNELGKFVGKHSYTTIYRAFDLYYGIGSEVRHTFLLRVAKDEICRHKFSCIRAFSLWAFEMWAWSQKFPNYCTKCEGSGVIEWDDDPSPPGLSLGSGRMYYAEPCSNCIENGCCPNCGEQVWLLIETQPLVCPLCDWHSDHPRTAPSQPECYCWEEEFYGRKKGNDKRYGNRSVYLDR